MDESYLLVKIKIGILSVFSIRKIIVTLKYFTGEIDYCALAL